MLNKLKHSNNKPFGGGCKLKAPYNTGLAAFTLGKCAFTLPEVATHVEKSDGKRKCAFTLAEVLITLGVIGVVAAITIPTLITKINEKVESRQVAVFEAKFIKGLNLTKVAGDMNNTYATTYDFLVNGLSKNLKMTQICDTNNLRNCIPYDKIAYETNNEEKSTYVKNLTTTRELNLTGGFKDVAAFLLADGTPVLVSYNLDCTVNPDMPDKTISSCVAGLYDINGSRKPNKFLNKIVSVNGKQEKIMNDVRSFNGASLSPCVGKINDICTASAVFGGDASSWDEIYNAIKAVRPNYSYPSYVGTGHHDYPKLGEDYCSIMVPGSHVPSLEELNDMAATIYGTTTEFCSEELHGPFASCTTTLDDTQKANWLNNKSAFFESLGLPDSSTGVIILSSDTESKAYRRMARSFGASSSNLYNIAVHEAGYKSICIRDN